MCRFSSFWRYVSPIALLCVPLSLSARGATIPLDSRNDRVFRLLDEQTGWVWIAPPQTNGQSAADAQLSFPGFRLPVLEEVVDFLGNAGLPTLPDNADRVDVSPAAANAFRQLMTDSSNVVGTSRDPASGLIGRVGLYTDGDQLRIEPPELSLQQPITFEGHWLVSVPEPSGFGLLLIAIVFVVSSGRYWT